MQKMSIAYLFTASRTPPLSLCYVQLVTCLTHPDGTLTPPTSEEAGDQHTTATNQSVHHRAVLRYHGTTPHHTKIAERSCTHGQARSPGLLGLCLISQQHRPQLFRQT
jgi:hypothetical protein